ncbi:MAG: membrane-bound lytic murein transglycosylase F [Bacteroidetes bacterium]|nr:membrane-bound lytic murein transglycosylase F [Bacteroidota bacterium]
MAVIETYVSKNPASSIIPLILFASFPLLQTGCYKPPSSAPYLNKSTLYPVVSGTGYNSEEFEAETPGESQKPQKYNSLVRKYSDRYDLDWILMLSVMKQESQFKPNARSRVGAFGLMQIMPITESGLTGKLGVKDAKSPSNNIKIGTFNFRSLYRIFRSAPEEDRIRLSLAAYNAGLARILDARQIAAYLGSDPNSWEGVKKALPLLSRSYYTLHQNIWDEAKPPSGYFRNWRQTTKYVEKVLEHYEELSLAFN